MRRSILLVLSSFYEVKLYKQHIETVIDYLEGEGVVVELDRKAISAYWKSKHNPLITINTSSRGAKRLYILLHEAGHHIVYTNKEKLTFLEEEHTAWDYGLHLAKKLDIGIDESKYWSYANYHLDAYKKELLNVAS